MHPMLSLLFVLFVLGTLGLEGYVLLRRRQFKLFYLHVVFGLIAAVGGVLKIENVPLPSIAQIMVAFIRKLGVNV